MNRPGFRSKPGLFLICQPAAIRFVRREGIVARPLHLSLLTSATRDDCLYSYHNHHLMERSALVIRPDCEGYLMHMSRGSSRIERRKLGVAQVLANREARVRGSIVRTAQSLDFPLPVPS